ncbi:MAG TPA: redox-regulated ATPase YchF [Clostridiaceae bacterium]|nr:redox-regulated ATPase YchF [Clostridiaceae bacterium]
MKLGIVGLPNVGKSTLFNALTKAGADVANYPFCTIDPNIGVVNVPDSRLEALNKIYHAKKIVHATIEFVDIAGLVEGASKGEGLGNQFLANIRETDAIVHVVRCFSDPNIIHVSGNADSVRDASIVQLELILSDIDYVERRIERVSKAAKSGDKILLKEKAFLEKLLDHLINEKPARTYPLDESEIPFTKELWLLTSKPVLYVANISETDIGTLPEQAKLLREYAEQNNDKMVMISAKIEEELQSLDPQEAAEFIESIGIEQSGLDQIISAGYQLLGLISFLTIGEDEIKAWTIKKGTKAPQAAGKIHTDFERGFIRAEVVKFEDLIANGSVAAAREKGLVKSEGKEYIMQDGDCTLFRFNV